MKKNDITDNLAEKGARTPFVGPEPLSYPILLWKFVGYGRPVQNTVDYCFDG